MDYAEFFEWYDFLSQNVYLLEQGLSEIEKGSPVRKMFKRNIKYQKRLLNDKVKFFGRKAPSTVRAFCRLGEEKANLLLKKLAKNHELCSLVGYKLAAIFPMAYNKASVAQRQLWLKVMGCREMLSYLVAHPQAWKNVQTAIKNSKSDDGTLAMESQLSEVLMNYIEKAEPVNETRAEMMTFAIE